MKRIVDKISDCSIESVCRKIKSICTVSHKPFDTTTFLYIPSMWLHFEYTPIEWEIIEVMNINKRYERFW